MQLTPPPEAEKVFTAPEMLGSKKHWAVPPGETRQVSPYGQRVTRQGSSSQAPDSLRQTIPIMHWTPSQPEALQIPSAGSQ